MDQIFNYIDSISEEIISMRRHLHQHPEMSFQEFETANFIEQQLISFGYKPKRIGKTGVVAMLYADSHTEAMECIALRADIDALPIQEMTDLPFKSKNEGVMHACGHDVHTSILLGTARTLMQFRNQLKTPIKFIFQPGEEVLPGGASILIEEGVLESPKVKEIYGLHVSPELKVGQIGWKNGVYMASCDELYIDIHGKGGHGALPQNCIDPIVIGANVVLNLQQVVSRNNDPRTPSVLTIGHFEGIGATNVIPSNVKMKGTFRTFDEEWRLKAHELIQQIVHASAEAAGARADVRIEKGYPFLLNDISLAACFVKKFDQFSEDFEMVELPIRMTSEDFAYYSHEIPSFFYRLGTANEMDDTKFGVHNNLFKIDERALTVGVKSICVNVLGFS